MKKISLVLCSALCFGVIKESSAACTYTYTDGTVSETTISGKKLKTELCSSYKFEYEYDNNENMVNKTKYSCYSNNCTTKSQEDRYTYDAAGNKTSFGRYKCNRGVCTQSDFVEYTPTGNALSSSRSYSCKNGTCTQSWENIYVFDENGNLTLEKSYDCKNGTCTENEYTTKKYVSENNYIETEYNCSDGTCTRDHYYLCVQTSVGSHACFSNFNCETFDVCDDTPPQSYTASNYTANTRADNFCPSSCSACNADVVCSECNSGFTLHNGKCYNPQDVPCNENQVKYQGECMDEYPFAKKHYTPSEANQWLNDSDNTITLIFKK